MKVLITVTADDIKNGKQKDGHDCPVARGVMRACDVGLVWVSGSIELQNALTGETEASATTPQNVSKFIDAFDRGEPVTPFEFTAEFFDEE